MANSRARFLQLSEAFAHAKFNLPDGSSAIATDLVERKADAVVLTGVDAVEARRSEEYEVGWTHECRVRNRVVRATAR